MTSHQFGRCFAVRLASWLSVIGAAAFLIGFGRGWLGWFPFRWFLGLWLEAGGGEQGLRFGDVAFFVMVATASWVGLVPIFRFPHYRRDPNPRPGLSRPAAVF